MPRSLKKGPYIEPKLLKKVMATQQSRSSRVIKTWSRRSTVIPFFSLELLASIYFFSFDFLSPAWP